MPTKIGAKRQNTFPTKVPSAMEDDPSVGLAEESDRILPRPQSINTARLAPLRDKLRRGHGSFDIAAFREQTYDPALGD